MPLLQHLNVGLLTSRASLAHFDYLAAQKVGVYTATRATSFCSLRIVPHLQQLPGAMHNTGKFAGRTAIISGASRGIGKAIALKLAKDGANIAILAKTTTPHPKLPGTIYTAAEEIEKAGGKALACVVDVRDESAVQKAVEETVNKFGGVDICINNASAIALTSTLDTPMKRYDLMNQINARGTFLLSQKCVPYLKQSKNAHILNISPPLLMEPMWFSNHVAYTIAKYGMSMCALGMAEEFRTDGIAVNCLWPKTAIWTAAMEMLSADTTGAGSRTVDIMADAAYAMLSRNSRSYSGIFAIDEDVLGEEGVTDFEKYACKPGAPLNLDLFVPGYVIESFTKQPERKKSRASIKSASIGDAVDALKKLAQQEHAKKLDAIFLFKLKEEGGNVRFVFLDLKNGTVEQPESENAAKADVVFELDMNKFTDMINGQLSPTTAFVTKQMRISGDISQALKLEKIIRAKL